MIFSDIRIKEINSILHFVPKTMKFSTEGRTSHIIGIQLSGRAKHSFADRNFMLEENCLYFFNQKEDYRVEIEEKGLCFSIHFTTFLPISTKSFCVKIMDNSLVLRMLSSIEQQYAKAGKCTAKILSELYKLLGFFEDIYLKEYSPQNTRILDAMKYINLHFKETDCIARAAETYGVTPRRFNDIFKQTFHTTPNQYIINHKIDLAKKLLERKELSISDISRLCGFEDIYYFSKNFKKVTGQTASNFRKQI